MRIRETLLGLVVLGLVFAGVFWARGRPPSPWAGDDVRSPGPSGPTSPAEAAMPDVTLADGVVDLGDVLVILSVTPRPPVAFARTRFRVRVESGGAPLALEGGRISFEMVMPMGDHRYTLVPGEDGWQEAEVVLPFCKSGNARWHAIVEGTVAGRPSVARFRLDLTRPGPAPSP